MPELHEYLHSIAVQQYSGQKVIGSMFFWKVYIMNYVKVSTVYDWSQVKTKTVLAYVLKVHPKNHNFVR